MQCLRTLTAISEDSSLIRLNCSISDGSKLCSCCKIGVICFPSCKLIPFSINLSYASTMVKVGINVPLPLSICKSIGPSSDIGLNIILLEPKQISVAADLAVPGISTQKSLFEYSDSSLIIFSAASGFPPGELIINSIFLFFIVFELTRMVLSISKSFSSIEAP